jgi:BAI1-associated protein 3
MRMETGQIAGAPTNQYAVLEGREEIDTRPFELYFALQEFSILKQHLSVQPQPPEKPLGIQSYHLWFESIIQLWVAVSKNKALSRVRAAISMDEICEGEKIVRHSTSSVDIASVIYQLKEFWRLLAWPDTNTGVHFEAQFIDAACSTAICYCDLVHQHLMDSGYYEQPGPFKVSDEFCVSVNNLEYVRRALSEFRTNEQNQNQMNQMQQMLDTTLQQLERTTERIMNRITITMQSSMQKSVFHLVSIRSYSFTEAFNELKIIFCLFRKMH